MFQGWVAGFVFQKFIAYFNEDVILPLPLTYHEPAREVSTHYIY